MFTVVDTPKKLMDMCSVLKQRKKFAIDTETTGLHLIRSRIILIPITSYEDHWVIPVRMVTVNNLSIKLVRKYLGPLLKNRKIKKYLWNTKYDRHMLYNDKMHLCNTYDGMVMGWLLDENRPKSLKTRCQDVGLELSKFPFSMYYRLRNQYLAMQNTVMRQDPGKAPLKRDYANAERWQAALVEWREQKTAYQEWKKEVKPLTPAAEQNLRNLEKDMLNYAYEDTLATWALTEKYTDDLKAEGSLWKIFEKVWNPYLTVLFKMERRGQCIDLKKLKTAQIQCAEKIEECAKKVYQLAGTPFNIASNPELADVLFNVLGCPVHKTTKKGAPAADAEALTLLYRTPVKRQHPYGHNNFVSRYPIAGAVLEWRNYSKLYGTYLGPNSTLVQGMHEGRLHGSFNATGTDTGRLSSSNPNLQNIPRNGPSNFFIRDLFIPPRGFVYYIADFSQIELRVIADKSKDKNLCDAYNDDQDIHEKTALGTGLDPETQRSIAKGLNFGAMYGIGPDKFAAMLTISTGQLVTPDQAEQYLDAFFKLYSRVPRYQEKCKQRIKEKGYTTTYLGRRRRLPEINSYNTYEQGRAARQGFNAEIQGGVADIMTYCMLKFDQNKWFRENRVYMVGQVHDEVHFIAPAYADPNEVIPRIKKIFEKPFPKYNFAVPIKFSCPDHPAHTWGAAK